MSTLSLIPSSADACTKPRRAKPQYPGLPDAAGCSENPLFWLCCWLRQVAEIEALHKQFQAISRQRRFNEILCNVLAGAHAEAKRIARQDLQYLVEAGGLLFSWAGTTKTREVAA